MGTFRGVPWELLGSLGGALGASVEARGRPWGWLGGASGVLGSVFGRFGGSLGGQEYVEEWTKNGTISSPP